MRGWIIFGVILLLLALLLLVRLGGEVIYSAQGLQVRIRIGTLWVTIIPKKAKGKKAAFKKKKAPRKKKQKEPSPQQTERPPDQKKGGLPIPLMELISLAVDGAGALLSRLQIDRLQMEYVFGGRTDPAHAATRYGMVYAGGDALLPLLENTFYCIKKRELQAWIDFTSDETLVWVCLGLSIRVGQLLAIAGKLGWRFLRAYRKKRQEDKKNGTKESDQ